MPKLDDTDIDMDVLEALVCYPSRETSIDEFLMGMVNLINSHDRAGKGMHDPDWLEVVGNPTIPHVQSLRQAPAAVALPVSKDKLIGLTTKNASKRYLQKLQKERERNNEVLTECVDNLPIVIRQMAYPESPPDKTPFRCSKGNTTHSAEKKFRVGKLKDDYWQENGEQWLKENTDKDKDKDRDKEKENSPRIARKTKHSVNDGREVQHRDKEDVTGDFVHHVGFAGVPNQTSALKHRFGKKKTHLVSESADSGLQKNTFRPKGFGALYDEMEFDRKYKKVFDLNKHIHFVHSNFVSGQRISKRAKLPPIGHNPSVFSDPSEGGDIFAIMSVQKYNYPEDVDMTRSSQLPSASNRHTKSDGPTKRHRAKRPLEIPREVDVPIGFVPGTVTKTGQSPFDGVKSTPVSVDQYEDSRQRDHSVSIMETPEEFSQTERSITSVSNRSRNTNEDKRTKSNKKKSVKKQNHETLTETTRSDDESELPFNISVHVELKPKGSTLSLEDVGSAKRKSARKDTNGRYSNQSSQRSLSDFRKETMYQSEPYISDRSDCEHDMFRERIVYPTPISTCDSNTRDSSDLDSPGHVIRPKHVTTTTSQYGVTSQKVKYPDRFILNESIAEDYHSGSEHSAHSHTASRQTREIHSVNKRDTPGSKSQNGEFVA